ncbi:MAG: NTP transferase domain-containing protein [Chitinivibrionales bacterium]|nr:NTP transferase domain-containing protein [Chitinivibrionales bacterium]
MPCLKLTLRSGRKVRKAVIPAAGFGTRLFPASKAIKKELFPIIGKDGKARPVIMAIIEEAVNAGIEQICLVVQKDDQKLFEDFFCVPPAIGNFQKLSLENQEYSNYVLDLGHRIHFAVQETQEGFGHAVYCAKDWVGNEPFLLMLGDHLYASDNDTSCCKQMIDAFERTGESVVGLKITPGDQINKFGCVTGAWKEKNSLMSITEFCEKPDLEYAREHLHVEGMDDDSFFTVFGQYILQSEIFAYLEEAIENNIREKGEFQLTSCLDKLRQEKGFSGYVVKGRRFDIGVPEAYRETVIDFRNA